MRVQKNSAADRITTLKKGYFLAPLFAVLISGCGEKWEGFVYPSKGNSDRHITTGAFASLEDCRANAVHIINTLEFASG